MPLRWRRKPSTRLLVPSSLPSLKKAGPRREWNSGQPSPIDRAVPRLMSVWPGQCRGKLLWRYHGQLRRQHGPLPLRTQALAAQHAGQEARHVVQGGVHRPGHTRRPAPPVRERRPGRIVMQHGAAVEIGTPGHAAVAHPEAVENAFLHQLGQRPPAALFQHQLQQLDAFTRVHIAAACTRRAISASNAARARWRWSGLPAQAGLSDVGDQLGLGAGVGASCFDVAPALAGAGAAGGAPAQAARRQAASGRIASGRVARGGAAMKRAVRAAASGADILMVVGAGRAGRVHTRATDHRANKARRRRTLRCRVSRNVE